MLLKVPLCYDTMIIPPGKRKPSPFRVFSLTRENRRSRSSCRRHSRIRGQLTATRDYAWSKLARRAAIVDGVLTKSPGFICGDRLACASTHAASLAPEGHKWCGRIDGDVRIILPQAFTWDDDRAAQSGCMVQVA